MMSYFSSWGSIVVSISILYRVAEGQVTGQGAELESDFVQAGSRA